LKFPQNAKKLIKFEHVSHQLRLSKQPAPELLMPALVTISGGKGAYKGRYGLWNMRQEFGFVSRYRQNYTELGVQYLLKVEFDSTSKNVI